MRGSAFEKKTFLRLSDYKRTSVQDEDNDVAAERQRIYDGGSKTDILQIRDLSKVKANKHPSVCFLIALFSFESLVLYSIFIAVGIKNYNNKNILAICHNVWNPVKCI